MPSKTSKKKPAAALPSIPKELIDQMVSGPMSAEAVNAALSQIAEHTPPKSENAITVQKLITDMETFSKSAFEIYTALSGFDVEPAVQKRAAVLADGQPRLEDLKALIARSRLVLTNDTGPRHVAAALGTPVVVVLGPTHPVHSESAFPGQRVLREDVPCSPCQLRVCPIDHRCLEQLAPERAVTAAVELLT